MYSNLLKWTDKTIGEVIYPVSETFKFNEGSKVHFLNTGDILEGKLLHTDLTDVKTLPGQAKKSFKPGDVLFSEIRPQNKRYMLVNFDSSNSVASTKLMVLRPKEGVDINFIYKFLTYQPTLNEFQLIAESRSGTFPQITFDAISKFKFKLPPLDEQKKIASFLSSLDNKIELLYQQNNTIENLLDAVFLRNFPNLEEVSKSFKLSTLVNHLKINVKPFLEKDLIYTHYSLPAYDNKKTPSKELGLEILSNKYKVIPGSILISKLNPMTPRIWAIYDDVEKNSICSTEFQVIQPKDSRLFEFVYFLLRSKAVTKKLSSSVGGTSGSHQRIRPDDILNIDFNLESKDSAFEFCKDAEIFRKKIINNNYEISNLVNLKELLLPKLMKGELSLN